MSLKAKLASVKAQLAISKAAKAPIIMQEPVGPPPPKHQDPLEIGGQESDLPLEHASWASQQPGGSSELPSWYQSDLDKEMEKRNTHYAKRDKESLSLARSLWLARNLRVDDKLP